MRMAFRGIVKSNMRGTGHIHLPQETKLKTGGNQLKISLSWKGETASYYKSPRGFRGLSILYIPKGLMKTNELMGKRVSVKIESIKGFVSKVMADGRIYIPNRMAEKRGIKNGDAFLLKITCGEKPENLCVKIHSRQKNNTVEYSFLSRKPYWRGKDCKVEIIKKLKRQNCKLLDKEEVYKVDKNTYVVFSGNSVPMLIVPNMDTPSLSHYLGAYFADGTKKGNYWRINASTPEQARYYIKQHKKFVKDGPITLSLTYTDIGNRGEYVCKEELVEAWRKEGINIRKDRIYIIKPKGKGGSKKWNPKGSLSISDQRSLTLLLYNRLLEKCLGDIIGNSNQNAAIDFICGVLEGDGSVAAPGRGHVTITTSTKDKTTLKKILNVWGVEYNTYHEKGNKWSIRIGALQILEYLPELHKNLFVFYPARRKRLVERFFTVGATQYILGTRKKVSGWVKAWLRDEGLVDDAYKLTPSGKEVRKCLVSMQKSVVENS